MATQNPFGAAVLGPDVLQKQADLQKNQYIAQMLMQQGAETPQGQMISGHYVAPSPLQGLTNALKSYMGYQALSDLPKQQAELMDAQRGQVAQQFGLGAPGAGLGAALAGSQPQPQAQAQPQSSMPLLPGRSPQESMAVYMGVGPQAYFKMIGEQGNTMTDIQKNLIAQGIQPGTPQWNAALGANMEKQNYIAPPNAAPGATLIDPRTKQPIFNAPQNGMQLQYGPDGVAKAMPVPGYSDITAKQEGDKARATAGANAEFDLVEVPNPSGQGSTYMTRAQLAQQAQAGGSPQAKPDPRTGKADTIISLANEASDILKNASSGLIGSLKTSAADAAGVSTKASQADARLNVISGQLVMNMPRMEGPQSDADRLLYQKMAGDIANPKLPRETREAALQTMIGLQKKYATPQQAPAQSPNAASAAAIASPRTAQEMQALPSGTMFRAPDGSIRKVP